MSNFSRFALAVRPHTPLAAAALLLAAAALPGAARAQTAPQLLPYTSKLIAGGGTQAIASGATCPLSGFTSTDAYGDGCLASEIQLVAPRYAIADSTGAVFVSDYTNGLIRRVDPITGVITAVAGGKTASPSSGSTCGTGASIDSRGDGCPANLVHLSHPTGLAFAANGDLVFADAGQYDVRRVAATAGFITTTGTITNIAGYAAGGSTYGFVISNSSTQINAATQSYLDAPYGLQFDQKGDLFIAEEFKNAILVVNTNATGSNVVNGVTVPAGQILKIAGAAAGNATTCPNGTSGTFGCAYGTYVSGASANASFLDNSYGVAVDTLGNVFEANEYNQVVAKVDTNGILTNFAGTLASYGASLTRTTAGSAGIGSDFGITADLSNNVYFTDALNGVIWRVDAGTNSQYVVAGGAKTTCSAATDTYGDGCPATQATLGATGSKYATAASPGVFGVTVDAFSDLFYGDTITNLVREVASGTQFGLVGANQPTDTLDIHFGPGDSPAANAYTITTGAASFSVGTATCTANSNDNTMDCLLPVTATPSVLGAFTGTLQVKSSLGAVGTFPLSGNYVVTPFTRTAVTINTGVSCTGATTISTTTPVTLTATITSTGTPGGTVQFFSNGAPLGTPQPVVKGAATLVNTFSTTGSYTITATYSGDAYFKASSGKSTTVITTANPSFSLTLNSAIQSTVAAGGTGLYSFIANENVYTGTLTFSCSGLPANSSCVFSPASLTATGCSATPTVALSIVTQNSPVKQASFVLPMGRTATWQVFGVVPGVLLAMFIGLRRRRLPARFGQLGMVVALLLAASSLTACGKGLNSTPTPVGTYSVTVTATGTTGAPATMIVPLTVTPYTGK